MEAVSSDDWPMEQPADGGVRRLAPPPRSFPLAAAAIAIAAGVSAAFWILALRAVDKLHASGGRETAAQTTVSVIAGIVTLLLIPGVHAAILSRRAGRLADSGEIVAARHVAARARERAQRTLGAALAAVALLGVTLFLLTNNAVVIETFFSWAA